jgi:membrane protein implicated in regulation of membrane protease activity
MKFGRVHYAIAAFYVAIGSAAAIYGLFSLGLPVWLSILIQLLVVAVVARAWRVSLRRRAIDREAKLS